MQNASATPRRPARNVKHVLATGLVVAGLGTTAIAAASAGGASTGVTISTAKSAKLGTIIVAAGKTAYTLNKKDCNAACLKYWPAVLLGTGATTAVAGAGVSASKLGRVKDAKGAWQATYQGKALYYFVGDKSKGQVNGNGLSDTWGRWSVVVTAKPAAGGGTTTTKPPTSTTTTTSPSGGGVSF